MSDPFEFTVTDCFVIEGRGLALLPSFPMDQYHFDLKEQVIVKTPDGRHFEADADIEHISKRNRIAEWIFLIRNLQKTDVPLGSKVTLKNKTKDQSVV